jgi:hypothetical protein
VLTSLVAVGGGGILLLTSRSKAALGAFALGLPLLLLAALGLRRTLLRPWIALPLGLALAAAIGAQFLPESLVQRLAAGRYTADAVRVLRLDVATDYLEANRLGPWTAAARAGLDAPWFGAGLGRLPAVFPDYRDAELVTDFNPLHENAHNQWLQSFAEEGAVGVAWLTLLFVGAGYGAWRRVRLDRSREPATDSATLWASAGLATVPVVLAINLQVGHSLLELPVALWVGALLGCAWSAADRPEPALAPSTRRPALAVAAAAVIGLLPAWFTPRPALEGFGFGAYPWVARTTTAAGRDRLLTPDARWIEVWGQGSRLVLAVLDPRPLLIPGTMTVTVSIDGQEVGTDLPLLRPADATAPLPTTLLKLDPPQPMRAGQRFELRLRTAPAYAETQHGASGRDWIGPRVSAPAFVDPRSR